MLQLVCFVNGSFELVETEPQKHIDAFKDGRSIENLNLFCTFSILDLSFSLLCLSLLYIKTNHRAASRRVCWSLSS